MKRPNSGQYAEGIEISASEAVTTAREMVGIIDRDRDRIAKLGRAATSALAVHHALQYQPIASAASLVERTGLTAATVNKSLAHLERVGVVKEITSRQRGRLFSYHRYIASLDADLGLGLRSLYDRVVACQSHDIAL